MASDKSWMKIFEYTGMDKHDFNKAPFELTADQIKKACQDFTKTTEKEVRILCKQDERSSRPDIFKKNGLFILPNAMGYTMF